jgi:methylphosphotriester-DNA--protein-cysteine methyltransferase
MVNGTMNCEQIWHEISNYIEGDVNADLRAAMDEHFRTCARCKSVLEGTRNVIRLYGDERLIEVPSGFSRRMEKRLAQDARASRRSWSTWLIPVAALLLIAGGMQFVSLRHKQAVRQAQIEQAEKNIPPDMTVLVTADSKIFHVAGCSLIEGKQVRSLTAKEALKEGYAPCTRCLRKYLETAGVGKDGPVVAAGVDGGADDDDEPPGGQ